MDTAASEVVVAGWDVPNGDDTVGKIHMEIVRVPELGGQHLHSIARRVDMKGYTAVSSCIAGGRKVPGWDDIVGRCVIEKFRCPIVDKRSPA